MSETSSNTPSTSRLARWDRIGLVALILVGCSSGMVALVGGTDAEEEAFTRLTHPKPVVALQKKEAHPVLLRQRSNVSAEEEAERDEAQTAVLDRNAAPAATPEPEVVPAPAPEPAAAPEEAPKATERDKSILPCSCCRKTMRVPKNPYTAHQSAARALPNSFFVKNDVELNAGKRNGKLVEITDGRGYRVDRLTHSHPWLLPETYQLLKDMGNDFADAMEGTKSEGAVFRVTSVTRTDKQQRKLRRRNANATNSKSTHSYGASFDIAFIDRFDDSANCGTPTREMERLLNRYQKAGIIYVIPEGNCMHITLRKP
jgi:D-alanyl-D-alanine dipeptidase